MHDLERVAVVLAVVTACAASDALLVVAVAPEHELLEQEECQQAGEHRQVEEQRAGHGAAEHPRPDQPAASGLPDATTTPWPMRWKNRRGR